MVGQSRLSKTLTYVAVIFCLLVVLFPVYWLFTMSFKSQSEFEAYPPTMYPHNPTLENFRAIWVEQDFSVYVKNSLVVALGATALAVTVGTLAAYALSRFRLPYNLNYHVLFTILTVRMFPPIVTIIPMFAWYYRYGPGDLIPLSFLPDQLADSRLGLALLHGFGELPLVIWMMIGFFRDIPRDMEEAALVDGDHRFAVLWKIAVPLARPGIAATGVLVFIASWNEFLYALIMMQSKDAQTLPKAIAGQISQFNILYGNIMAAAVIATVPVLVLALLAQRHLTRGLTVGGVTG